MEYDFSRLDEIVKEKKRRFKIKLAVLVALFIIVIAEFILYYGSNDYYVFYSGAAAVILIIIFSNTMKKYRPEILFSPEIKGINIKEDEYVLLAQKRGYRAGKYSRYVVPPAGSGMPSQREKIVAAVYIRCDDGNVYLVDRISTAHTNLYEIGDTLYKPAGAKYPIILNRDTAVQPCPLCGTLNDGKKNACMTCDLSIFIKQ